MIREKLNLFYTNLKSMPYVGGNECSLIKSYEVKTKFIHDQGWKRYLLSDFILRLSYTKQDYCWPRSSQLNPFKEPYIPPLREELHVEENTFLEEYVEVKEENI